LGTYPKQKNRFSNHALIVTRRCRSGKACSGAGGCVLDEQSAFD
jgi:hypothetical protein